MSEKIIPRLFDIIFLILFLLFYALIILEMAEKAERVRAMEDKKAETHWAEMMDSVRPSDGD